MAPSFLLACLLWHEVLAGWERLKSKGEPAFPALQQAIDAVFDDGDGGFEVVDWKTGPPPSGPALAAAAVQLAAYRLGWSRLTGVPVERVSAGFHHVAAGVTVRPVDLLDEAGLAALIEQVPAES